MNDIHSIVESVLRADCLADFCGAVLDRRGRSQQGDMLNQRTMRKRMTTRSVQRMLKRYPISIDGKPTTVTPHDLRLDLCRLFRKYTFT